MSTENRNISCDIYLDLIPLVRDEAASEDSKAFVFEHIKICASCRAEFENANPISNKAIDDKKIIKSIRKSMLFTGFLFIVFGALMGVYLSDSMGMFYNILIMPIVGACGYLTLKRKWYIVPACIFALTCIYLIVQQISGGVLANGPSIELIFMPLFLSSIYLMLTLLGVLITFLIKFALGKEGTK